MTKPNGFSFMRIWFSIGFSVLLISTGIAQTNNQPYSIHAIGDITDNIINRTSGLGSTGIAYRNDRWIINNNPAALSGLTNQFFCAEIGVNGQFIDYSGQQVSTTNHTSTDITFKRFAVATKIFRNWGSSIGLVPFSEENYEYAGSRPIGGTGSYLPTYDQGYGGINKVFWANGVELIRNHLSLGLTTSYLFGSINNKNIISGQGTNIYLSKNNNTYFNKVYFDYGLQWYGSVDAHWDYSIGGVFANEQTLRTQTTVNVLNLDSNVLRSTVTSGSYTIPTSYGLGFTVTRNKTFTLLADYRFQNWGSLVTTTGDFFYKNSQRFSAGFEFSRKKVVYNTLYETHFFQAGFYYNKTYLIVNSTPIDDIGATLGVGVNSKRTPMSFNVILQYGIRGTTNNNLIRENYANISFVFSFRDFWYTKGRRIE